MVKYDIEVSDSEAALIETMQNLRYGEMFSVEIDARPAGQAKKVSANVRSLLEWIRDGAQHIDVLTVHEGEPVLAEIDYQHHGFRCRKRIKFPTTKTEG